MTKVLRPSGEFIQQMCATHGRSTVERILDRVCKEFEIYEYFASNPPAELDERTWEKLMRTKRVRDRLKLFESVSKAEASHTKRRGLKQETQVMVQRILTEQQAKYDSGGMGYGPGMYQLLLKPGRNRQARRVEAGSRMWRSLRINELPTISLDMKFFSEDTIHAQHRLGMQVTEMVTHNLQEVSNPFPMQFVNFDRNLLCEEVRKVICPYGPYAHDLITPDELVDNPLEANPREAIYISRQVDAVSRQFTQSFRFSNNILDGPLTNFSNIILPVTDDTHRQSLGTFRRVGFHHAKLPVQAYLRPELRPLKVKLGDVLKLFAEVCRNGGDWKTALHTVLIGSKGETIGEDVAPYKVRMKVLLEIEGAIHASLGRS